jgi:hypothetical protein
MLVSGPELLTVFVSERSAAPTNEVTTLPTVGVTVPSVVDIATLYWKN